MPVESARVDKMRVKGAGDLAMLIPLDGERFATALHLEEAKKIQAGLAGAQAKR